MASRPALRRCVRVDPDTFGREIWARAPLLSTATELAAAPRALNEMAARSAFDDLFSLEAVDELLSRRGLRTPFIRLAKDGVVVPASRYTGSGGTGAQVSDQVIDDRVAELFADGHTVVLQGLHRLWPPLIDFAGALAEDLGHPVQINAYVTPSSSQGFSAHYDVHDVFVLQVAGEKRWAIHPPVHTAPLRDQPWTDRRAEVAAAAERDPVIDAVLRPGDALYLPRGYLHSAQALGDVSAHLTIGVHPLTRHHLVEALLGIVTDDEALRTSLPLGVDVADPDDLQADVAATVAALTQRLASVSAAEVAARLAPRRIGGNRPAPLAPLAQVRALGALGQDSVLRLRRHLRPVLTTADSRPSGDRPAGDPPEPELTLDLPDRTLRFPVTAGDALRALLPGERVRVADLPGLEADEALTLAQRLVRHGVVVVDTP